LEDSFCCISKKRTPEGSSDLNDSEMHRSHQEGQPSESGSFLTSHTLTDAKSIVFAIDKVSLVSYSGWKALNPLSTLIALEDVTFKVL
jgi:hypothetical protein